MIELKTKIRQYLGIDDSINGPCERCEEKERHISYLQNEIQVLKKEIEIGSKKKIPTEQSVRKIRSWPEIKEQLLQADMKAYLKRESEKQKIS